MNEKIKKKIITSTFMFILATVFILIFKTFFGEENSLIGVSCFIAMLLFMERDLTGDLLGYAVGFIIVNLVMGIGAFIVNINMWIGIPVNFIIVFLTGYYFCHDLKKPAFVPFMLQYLFLLECPVKINQEPIRLLSLFVGALCIMIPQILFNMKKLEKESNKVFMEISRLLKEKTLLVEASKEIDNLTKKINSLANSLKISILQRQNKNYGLSKNGEVSLSILTCLEKINIILSKESKISKIISKFIIECLECFNEMLNHQMSYDDFKNKINLIANKYESEFGESITYLQILNSFKSIGINLTEFNKKTHISISNKIKETFNIVKFIQDNKENVGFSYGVRAAIGVTLTCFLTQILKLEEGYWMMFTIYSLVNPIYEVSKYKSKDRVVYTFLGAIVVIILLSIFKEPTERSIILLLVGYIMTYMVQYKNIIFFATICIVTMATGAGNVTEFALQRFGYVIIGLCIAILLNKFVLKRNLNDVNENLKEKYKNIIVNMMDQIYTMAKTKNISNNNIKKEFLKTSLIENKIKENFQLSLTDFNPQIDINNRILALDVFNLYIELENNIEKDRYVEFLADIMEKLKNVSFRNYNIEEIKQNLKDVNLIEEKLAYFNLYEIGQYINYE